MTETITRLYGQRGEAEDTFNDLLASGIDGNAISLVGHGEEADPDAGLAASPAAESAGTGAGIGGVLGGAGGLLAGLGVIAIPGLGPIVAAGWLASTAAGVVAGVVTGAAAGGIVGLLMQAGLSEADAAYYATGFERGGTLLTVRVDEPEAERVRSIMDSHNPRWLNSDEEGQTSTDEPPFSATRTSAEDPTYDPGLGQTRPPLL